MAVFALYFGAGSVFLDAQPEFFSHYVGNTDVFFGNLVGHGHAEFHPVDIFFKSEAFHMAHVVGIIVYCGHGSHFVEAFDEHAFVIHVGKSHRADDVGHTSLRAPFLHGGEKLVDNFLVVDKVGEAESQVVAACFFVDGVVDDGCDGSDRVAVSEGHEASQKSNAGFTSGDSVLMSSLISGGT